MLLWELFSLKRAFKKLSRSPMLFKDNAFVGVWGPSLSAVPSKALSQSLINDCWEDDPEKRPNITKVLEVLNMESSYRKSSNKNSKSSLNRLKKTLVARLPPLFYKIHRVYAHPAHRSHTIIHGSPSYPSMWMACVSVNGGVGSCR
jgi:hypothetical protein